MKISYEWLGDYLDTSGITPHEAAELLTMTGTKVESVQVIDLSEIIVGRVLEQKDHPRSNKPLWIHQVYIEGVPPPAAELIDVAIEAPELCTRFVAIPITGVKVGPSPDWVQRRLRAAGVRPISNVVDATAYVMLEHGKPTHVFDAAKLHGPQLHVRDAREGESILCLDGQTRRLRPGMLVVADAKGPVAIGGIIGGEDSGVSDTTTDVVIESAGWDGVNIRATSRALGLRTDASLRHE